MVEVKLQAENVITCHFLTEAAILKSSGIVSKFFAGLQTALTFLAITIKIILFLFNLPLA